MCGGFRVQLRLVPEWFSYGKAKGLVRQSVSGVGYDKGPRVTAGEAPLRLQRYANAVDARVTQSSACSIAEHLERVSRDAELLPFSFAQVHACLYRCCASFLSGYPESYPEG